MNPFYGEEKLLNNKYSSNSVGKQRPMSASVRRPATTNKQYRECIQRAQSTQRTRGTCQVEELSSPRSPLVTKRDSCSVVDNDWKQQLSTRSKQPLMTGIMEGRYAQTSRTSKSNKRNIKNFVNENKKTLGFQASHPLGNECLMRRDPNSQFSSRPSRAFALPQNNNEHHLYNKIKSSSGISRKINSRTVAAQAIDQLADELLNRSIYSELNSSRSVSSRPSSASSIKRVEYKPTARHAEIVDYCHRAIPFQAWSTNGCSPREQPVPNSRSTQEPAFDRKKTKRLEKDNIAGFLPNSGAKLFEQSSMPPELLETYRPKKRGLPMPAPGPHTVVMAVHSSRHPMLGQKMSRITLPVHPENQ